MAKFCVNVTVIARSSYEVIVDADDQEKAENFAIAQWRAKVSPGFQVVDADEFEVECDQIAWSCESCGKTIPRDEWSAGGGLCKRCAEAEDAA